MVQQLSTRYWPEHQCQPRWAEAIGNAYFPLSLEFSSDGPFQGNLQIWETPAAPSPCRACAPAAWAIPEARRRSATTPRPATW